MSKILISPIGTGKPEKGEYNSAKYLIEGEIYETSFITVALRKHYKFDKVIYLGTMGSIWEEVYKTYCDEFNTELDAKLYDDLFEMRISELKEVENKLIDELIEKFKDKIDIILLRYGVNEGELLENLDHIFKIADKIEDGDELYIDITHSFRSLSLYNFVLVNYISEVLNKKVEIKGVYYGMFEAKDEKGQVPVVNLNIIFEIMKWIKGAHSFQNYGNGYLIAELIEDKKIKDKINNFSDVLNINNLSAIKKNVDTLKKISKQLDGLTGLSKFILPNVIKSFLNKFKKVKSDATFQLNLADWYYENKKYSQSYITLYEAVITYACEYDGENPDDRSKREEKKKELRNNRFSDKKLTELKELESIISNIRNGIAHSLEGQEDRYKSDIDNLSNRINKLKRIINK